MTTPEEHIDQIIKEATQNEEPEQPEALNSENVNVFNQALNQYLRVDEEIKTLMEAVKARNQVKKKLGETISSFLKTNKIARVDLDGSYKGKRLESTCKETPVGFNRNSVVGAIHDELKEDTELFDKIMQALQRVSVIKEVWKLKITEEKKARAAARKNQSANTISEAANKLENINM